MKSVTIVLAVASAAISIGLVRVESAAAMTISEYVEGSGVNKALEILNTNPFPVDLAASAVDVQIYLNGSVVPTGTIALSGVVAAGDVLVIANSGAAPGLLALADMTTSALNFNGDDAVVLRVGGVAHDVIGQIGFDPGSEWTSGGVGTADETLRRKAEHLCSPDPNGADVFQPALQWDSFAQDTFGDLGLPLGTCGAVGIDPGEPASWGRVKSVYR